MCFFSFLLTINNTVLFSFKDQDQTHSDVCLEQHRDSGRRTTRKEKTRLAHLAVTQVNATYQVSCQQING